MDTACANYQEDLSAFLDQQLNDRLQADMSAHLKDCQDCTARLETMKSLSQMIERGIAEAPVPDIWGAICRTLPSTCEVIQEDLSAYIDSELPAGAQEGINQHLKDCSDCRQKFALLNSTNVLISKGLELQAQIKVDLWPAVRARLNEDCALMQSELSAFVDQEVPASRHRSITSHLIDCPTCRLRFEELSSVGEFMRNFYQPELADDFDLWPAIKSKMQVVAFVPRAKSRPHLINHRLYLAGAAAVVVGLVGSLVYLFALPPTNTSIRPVSAESYLLDSALNEPASNAEAVVYGNQ